MAAARTNQRQHRTCHQLQQPASARPGCCRCWGAESSKVVFRHGLGNNLNDSSNQRSWGSLLHLQMCNPADSMLALAFSKLAFVASAVCQMASSMLMRVPAALFCRASACCPALFVRCPKHYCVMSFEQGVWEQMTAMSVLLVAMHAQTGWRIFSGLVTFPSNQILGYSHLLYEAAENCKYVAIKEDHRLLPPACFCGITCCRRKWHLRTFGFALG